MKSIRFIEILLFSLIIAVTLNVLSAKSLFRHKGKHAEFGDNRLEVYRRESVRKHFK